MSMRVVRVRAGDDGVAAHRLREGIAAIRAEMELTADFPPEVDTAAERAAAEPRLPDLDRTDLPFVTLDPAGAQDLDQALHLERRGEGYLVHYAIADVAAFVTPGDPVDAEANRRGETLYGADSKIPLHPRAISEDAGSLLPDQVRPALLWTMELDATGEGTSVHVERALVRSRAQLTYDQVQAALDDGTADEVFTLLGEVGRLRLAREAARGGISLPLPEQEIDVRGVRWHLEFRSLHPVEEWNAQISLLTGMAAASLMVDAKVGLLRTLPPADPRDVRRLRRTARSLGIDWPRDQDYPAFIRGLDPVRPRHAAMVVACTRLLRGSGYAGFEGELPEQTEHSAIAAEYAHVTAPLRRLVDRYAGEVCVALCAGTEVPSWVTERLPDLPGLMQSSRQRANRYENAIVNLVEAATLEPHLGESFPGVVVEVDPEDQTRGEVSLAEPAVEARVSGSTPLPLGEEVIVRLVTADPATRAVGFELA
ncbi:RNB domain-containing ribonuclease [Nocardioides donggukensis]|uniref:RNB domain-containing ribonuclease n=1 Tax=Nocardioides donggukensis TaxID=2774019 RepID=A0A927K4W4_9ACTN|nr:RNB domain-containing ribonuclease [Nocardioides donggukensis]MBD8869931.1 RNB domain-containing ribonuclease [Nocardioides donggukensis]